MVEPSISAVAATPNQVADEARPAEVLASLPLSRGRILFVFSVAAIACDVERSPRAAGQRNTVQTRNCTIGHIMQRLASARFHTTVAHLRQLPDDGLAEVAFVGRSNAGKSSAINALCRRRKLAFSSRTPGRTQALNFFVVGPDEGPHAYLVDTPGYGYAAAPQELKKGWDQLGGRYLHGRENLRGVVLIVDIRRELGDRDRALLEWIDPHVPVLALASKADKLNRAQRQQARRNIHLQIEELRPEGRFAVMPLSVTQDIGVEEARAVIEAWLAADQSGSSDGGHHDEGTSITTTDPDLGRD